MPLVRLVTSFDQDLRLRRFKASEAVSRDFEFEIGAVSLRADLDPYVVLGRLATVALEQPDGSERFFNGHVTEFSLVGENPASRFFHYRLMVRPWLWLLTRSSDCRIFQSKSIPEILKLVFDGCGVASYEDQLTGQYEPWEYCVQYRESDFDFVSRLMEHEGIHYFFRHEENRHTLVLADSGAAHQARAGFERIAFTQQHRAGVEAEAIDEWMFNRSIQPGGFSLQDFNFKTPSAHLESVATRRRSHEQASGHVYDYPGRYLDADGGSRYSRTRLEELQARHERIEGAGNVRGLVPGHLFELSGHPREDQNDRALLLLSTSLQLEDRDAEAGDGSGGTSFHCRFTAMPASEPYRPPRVTRKPIVQGPQTAIVVGPAGEEIHTDEHGRVKVHFHWDQLGARDENDSCWIRVSHPWAGKGWGAVSIPRIGQEVIVDFLEGDPDRPIITGRVYNAEARAAYPLPGGAVVSGIKSNTHKGKGYNEMSMDDSAGKEKITIHAQYDMATTVEHDDAQTVHNNRTIKVDGTHTETVTKDTKITIESGTYSHDVAANKAKYHVSGDIDETYDSNQTTKTNQTISITSVTANIQVKAATKIELEVGASKITMDSAGTISITCRNLQANGSESVNISGGTVTSKADTTHNTEGQIVMSNGAATNTVKGGMVMLNP